MLQKSKVREHCLMEQRQAGGLPRHCWQCLLGFLAPDQSLSGSNILQEKKAVGGKAGLPQGTGEKTRNTAGVIVAQQEKGKADPSYRHSRAMFTCGEIPSFHFVAQS